MKEATVVEWARKRCEQCGKFKPVSTSENRTLKDINIYYCDDKCRRAAQKERNKKFTDKIFEINRKKNAYDARMKQAAYERMFSPINAEPMPEKPKTVIDFDDE